MKITGLEIIPASKYLFIRINMIYQKVPSY